MADIPMENGRYGWLYPDGRFRESDWGTHAEEAQEIIREAGCGQEFARSTTLNEGDFLCFRGFCLIHNPGRGSHVTVTHVRPLTRKQREFLCTYFLNRGEKRLAERYLEEEY